MSHPVPVKPLQGPVPKDLRLEYCGFRNTADQREYLLRGRLGAEERDYVVLIEHSAFADRRVALQDGPDICFQRLSRELTGGLVPLAPMTISDTELAAYRAAHTVAPRRLSAEKPAEKPH
jgi:hypothetical protein